MPRPGTAARRRAREGLPPANPGPVGWVRGTKVAFLEGYKDDFINATVQGKVKAGKFYDDVANDYLKKYGYKTPWDGDLKEGEEVASDVEEDEDVDAIPPAVAEMRSEYFNNLRKKIASWYRSKYGGAVTKNKKTAMTFRQLFDKKELDPPPPPRFEEKWATQLRLCPPGEKRRARISVQNEAIKEAWLAESEAFKNEVRWWKAKLLATPESFQIALDNAGYYLEPFINAIAQHFGMNASLLLCGPTPSRGGAIEMHSVHSGNSKGRVPRIWPDFDRAGFEAVRQSFRQFSEACFTTEDRLARSLNGMAEMPLRADTSHCWGRARRPAGEGGEDEEEDEGESGSLEGTGGDNDDGGSKGPDNEEDGGEGGGPNDEEEDGGEGGGPDDDEDDDDLGRNPATALWPALRAEIDLMDEVDRSLYMSRVRWGWSDEELLRQNSMARNRALMKEVMGDSLNGLFAGVQSDTSRDAAAAVKRRQGGEPQAPRKRKAAVPAGSPRKTRRHTRQQNTARNDGGAGPNDDEEGEEDDEHDEHEEDEDDRGGKSRGGGAGGRKRKEGAAAAAAKADQGSPAAKSHAAVGRPASLPPIPCSDTGGDVPRNRAASLSPMHAERRQDVASGPPSLPTNQLLPCHHSGAKRRDSVPRDLSNGSGGDDDQSPRGRDGGKSPSANAPNGGGDKVECSDAGGRRQGSFDGDLLDEVGEKWNPELRSAIRGFRRWGIPTELGFDAVGPREDASSFAHEWWGWWKLLQPKTRVEDSAHGLTRPSDIARGDWDELAKTHGRNGMLMSDWSVAVRDVLWALKECVVGVGELQKRIEAENKETKEKEKAAKKKRAEEEALVKKQRAEKRKTAKAQAAGPKAKKRKAGDVRAGGGAEKTCEAVE
ncbi:hypothetical protein B0H14DRAFT_3465977 [Mycena olivaceomarginata]|nr:hypothetical protein B0H14DRAFT_3465977 [Mycena olivaceomarginata]